MYHQEGVSLSVDLSSTSETKAKTGFLNIAEAKAYLLTDNYSEGDDEAHGDNQAIGYRIEDTYQNINAEKGSELLSNTKGLSETPGDDLRAIAQSINEAVALSEPKTAPTDVVKGGVISSYSLSSTSISSSDYKDLSVREFSAVNEASNAGSVKDDVTVEDTVDNIERTAESLQLLGTLDPSVVHAVGATKADAINMLKNTDDTAGAVAGSFDLKQLVVQDEGFKSININLGGGQAEWLLIANAAETEVTAIRGAGGGGTPEKLCYCAALRYQNFQNWG